MSLLRLAFTRSDLLPAFLKSQTYLTNQTHLSTQLNSKPETNASSVSETRYTVAPAQQPPGAPAVQARDLNTALIDNVNHEIRTPLAGIMATAQILHEIVAPHHQEFTTMLMENSRRMNNAISDVIELVALENNAYRVDTAPVALHREIKTLTYPYIQAAATKGITFKLSPISKEIILHTDPQLLRKTLNHLLDNAVKFTDEGSVMLSVEKEEKWLNVKIRDTGAGINTSFLQHIAEPFWQESNGLTRNYNGQGLGLALSHRMIQLAGGKISIQSTPGSGSTFTVSYPHAD